MAEAGGGGDVVVAGPGPEEPKRPRMSSTVDFCLGAPGGGEVEVVDGVEEPKISASRSWLDWAVGAGWPLPFAPGVGGTSSPSRSALIEVISQKHRCRRKNKTYFFALGRADRLLLAD